MYISLQSGAGGSKDWYISNIIIVLKWKSRFSLGLNTVKNRAYMRKRFKQKLLINNFYLKHFLI